MMQLLCSSASIYLALGASPFEISYVPVVRASSNEASKQQRVIVHEFAVTIFTFDCNSTFRDRGYKA